MPTQLIVALVLLAVIGGVVWLATRNKRGPGSGTGTGGGGRPGSDKH